METTKLYVEYIVVGMETLAIIFLVIFIIIGDAFLLIIKYCIKNIVPSIIMLGWCYILGLIVDRIADIIYDKRKMHIKEKYPIVAETSIIVWEHFKQDAFATFTLSRIRLMRSTALNSFAMLIVCTYAVRKYHCGWKITMLTVVGFLTMAIASDLAHFNLLNNYYKKTMKLENSYLNKGDVKSSEKASSQS